MKTIPLLKPPILHLFLFLFLNTSISIGQTISADGQAGPTLIITSQESNVFSNNSELIRSKCREFNITGEYTVNNCGVGSNIFLNNFVNTAAFGWKYYQRVIILEGEYVVNGPITIYNLGGTTSNSLGIGKITVEGEGFGTRIRNDASYTGPIFKVNSRHNTLKNLSIITTTNQSTGIELAGTLNSLYNCVLENLYIGTADMETDNSTPPNASTLNLTANPTAAETNLRTGIRFTNTSSFDAGHYNVFKNIIFNGLDKGIELAINKRLGHNHFQNLVFKNTVIGIDFINFGTDPSDIKNNVFDNLTIHKASGYSQLLLRNVKGQSNHFNHCNYTPSWPNDQKFITLHANSNHSTFKNATFSINQISDLGVSTQLINIIDNNNAINYRIGSNDNATGNQNINRTNLISKLHISKENPNGPAFVPCVDCLLKTQANNEAKWEAITGYTFENAWDYSADKHINMGTFGITFDNNSTSTAPGLYFNPNGNLKIGTSIPNTTDGSLQIDGNVTFRTLNTSANSWDNAVMVKDGKTIIGPMNTAFVSQVNNTNETYKLFVNGKMRIKDELRINQTALPWPDYVFQKDYDLMPLEKIEEHIQQNGHLPNMPCAAEVEQTGVPLATMITKQHEKIEELTLHLIELQKEIETLKQKQKK